METNSSKPLYSVGVDLGGTNTDFALVDTNGNILKCDSFPLELYLDGGWQFTFRIHNASTKVEPSLKFDIKIIGMPTSVITINCRWK